MFQKFECQNITDEIIQLTLNDTKSGNSFGIETARELEHLIKDLSASKSKIKVLIFTGVDRFFCSGGNLKFYRSLKSKAAGIKINREISAILKKFNSLKLVKIALVNGDCLGGGLELLSCFDIIYSRADAYFGFWQSKQGLSFGWGGGVRLASRISLSQARRSLLCSQNFSAYEAADMNLVDQVFSRFEIEAATLKLAHDLALNPRTTNSTIQRITSKNEESSFSNLWWSEEHLRRLNK